MADWEGMLSRYVPLITATMTSPANTNMDYVTLGSSGLKISKIILGCAVYGSPDWFSWVQNEEESIKQIKAAYDAGINTFDTANARLAFLLPSSAS
ncbi:hypothetical protein EDD85DRAFT_947915 [Armillaria nabsnona]|nr:hypothetical protein EDD85DRAFT_947915 [Armillaria nabsnona]